MPGFRAATKPGSAHVEHTDDHVISMARGMLKTAGLHGHKHTVDAVLAAVAVKTAECGFEVTVFTSDADNMGKSLADHPIRVERV